KGNSETGMLASWVQQCSFDPPVVCLALARQRPVSAWLVEGAVFALNILDQSQTDMIGHFGRGFSLDQPAFTNLEIGRSPLGLPTPQTEVCGYPDLKIEA